MKQITRDEVVHLMEQGAQIVEVLPQKEYREEHLAGAISLPLRKLEESARDVLDPAKTVVVYCWDSA